MERIEVFRSDLDVPHQTTAIRGARRGSQAKEILHITVAYVRAGLVPALAASLGASHEPHDVALFLMRCIFCTFAEDVDVDVDLFHDSRFTALLKRDAPQTARPLPLVSQTVSDPMKTPVTVFLLLLFFGAAASCRAEQDVEWEVLNEEAKSLYQKGEYDRAAVVEKKALDVAEKTVGSDHPNVAESLNNLALL